MSFMRIVLTALILALTTTPIQAADATLPPLAPLTSVRWDFVTTFNGRPLSICQEAYESYNRGHAVCHQLVTIAISEYGLSLVAGQIDEIVLYDTRFYQRKNDETSWTVSPNPIYNPNATLRDLYTVGFAAALTRIGTIDVEGTSTTQYQYWSLDPDFNAGAGGQAVYDLFLTPEGRVRKAQLSYRGNLSLGTGELQGIYVYRDFNAPITVGPPPANLVK